MTQKDDDGQEWFEWEAVRETYHGEPYEPASYYIREKDTKVVLQPALYETFTKQVMADHRNAQQFREQLEQERHYKRNANQQAASLAVEKVALEERVRVLEEALGKHVVAMHILQHANDVEWETCEKGMCPKARALLSPAAATEGAP